MKSQFLGSVAGKMVTGALNFNYMITIWIVITNRLVEIAAQKEAEASTSISVREVVPEEAAGVRVLIRNFGDEKSASEPFLYVPTMISDGSEVRT